MLYRVYTNITQIENSDSLQTDLNYIYLWAINNNMLFNHHKFNYISFSSSMSSINTNVYYSPSLDIINPSENVLDLGITMSRTFTSRGTTLMTLSIQCLNLVKIGLLPSVMVVSLH